MLSSALEKLSRDASPDYWLLSAEKAEDRQIIDLIRDSASTDFAMVQSGNLSGIGMTVHNCIKGEHANFASTYAAKIDAAKVKLSEMLNGK